MFDRYDEDAKRALFFARWAIVERGGDAIEPEHLVLGVLQGSPEAIVRFATGDDAGRVIEKSIGKGLSGPMLPGSHEIPFSIGAKAALERAVIEADDLSDPTVRPEHLVLGVLVKTSGAARDVLSQAGVTISAIREFLKGRI